VSAYVPQLSNWHTTIAAAARLHAARRDHLRAEYRGRNDQAQESGKTKIAMMVAVTVVRMVKMSADQIVDMISVRHGFVTATRTVLMTAIVPATLVAVRAVFGIG
jgi:hypothetical protein